MAQAATGSAAGKLVIRNIGLLLSGDLDNPILDAEGLQVAWQHVLGETWLLLVEIYGDQCEIDRSAALQSDQDVEQGI